MGGGMLVLFLFVIGPMLWIRFCFWINEWIVSKCPKCKSHKRTRTAIEKCEDIDAVLITFICNKCGHEFKSIVRNLHILSKLL